MTAHGDVTFRGNDTGNWLTADWLMVNRMTADWLMVDWLNNDWLMLDWLTADWLTIDWLTTDCLNSLSPRQMYLKYDG